VAEICRRLDGIPLAIELAAARVKVLSAEEIRARLNDRFQLLTGGSKTALGRQQTLLATIQWSYDHLAPDQQQLLRRLSVFVGGWTLEGAVRVAGEQRDDYAVLDMLGHLVDESLVTTHGVEGGTTRYAMLETVRQYAQDRLNEAGETEATRNRHLQFYVAFAEDAGPQLQSPEQRAWFARYGAERENFLAVHTWCDHAKHGAELGLRLVFSLRPYMKFGAASSGDGGGACPAGGTGAQRRSVPGALGRGRGQLLCGPLWGSQGLRREKPGDRQRAR